MIEDLEIIDCHHHLWDLKANYCPCNVVAFVN